jgi:hypothetical protein
MIIRALSSNAIVTLGFKKVFLLQKDNNLETHGTLLSAENVHAHTHRCGWVAIGTRAGVVIA